jgi:hypothetical protein
MNEIYPKKTAGLLASRDLSAISTWIHSVVAGAVFLDEDRWAD